MIIPFIGYPYRNKPVFFFMHKAEKPSNKEKCRAQRKGNKGKLKLDKHPKSAIFKESLRLNMQRECP
jgi:hypothetical protein